MEVRVINTGKKFETFGRFKVEVTSFMAIHKNPWKMQVVNRFTGTDVGVVYLDKRHSVVDLKPKEAQDIMKKSSVVKESLYSRLNIAEL